MPGSQIDEEIIHKIVLATRSYNTGKRTAATLTFIKLCRCEFLCNVIEGVHLQPNDCILDRGVRQHLLNQQALDSFTRQLRRKETSLLAAYTLMTCLKYGESALPLYSGSVWYKSKIRYVGI